MAALPIISPIPTAGPHWESDAACKGTGSSTFYAADGERGASRRTREARAKTICGRCAVIDNCLRWALATQEPWGVWGGMSSEERALSMVAFDGLIEAVNDPNLGSGPISLIGVIGVATG